MVEKDNSVSDKNNEKAEDASVAKVDRKEMPKEIGGRDGPEPTRYGDWENKGIASDF